MIILRAVAERDVDGLEELSKIAAEKHPGFINMTNDRDQWRDKIRVSLDSFAGRVSDVADEKFIFVAEDGIHGKILGVSMIATKHGTEETPHFFFEVGNEQKFSDTINTGFIHGTLRLKYDTDGPTEIGGLLLHPDSRNSDRRIGRQISFVRFLYMGMYRSHFNSKVLAELLPPLTKRGKSPLWEAVGRRFTNMDYTEADILSGKNKEFIFSLFPTGKIYVTFLPAEARNAIGKVSRDTEPVMHMLKKIGFQYRNQVDPFDGGPHMLANTDDIVPLQNIQAVKVIFESEKDRDASNSRLVEGLVTVSQQKKQDFKAVHVAGRLDGEALYIHDRAALVALKVDSGTDVTFMRYY